MDNNRRESPTVTCLGQYAERAVYISDECFTCTKLTLEEYKKCPWFKKVEIYREQNETEK